MDFSSLETSLSHWEWAEYTFTALVVVAVAGEFIAEFTDFLTGGEERKKRKLAKGSVLVLIAALALELVCLFRTNQLAGRIVAVLDREAEQERLARIKVEEQAANREIAPEASKALSKKLSAFAGQTAEIAEFPVTFEHNWIAGQIYGIVLNAGWKVPKGIRWLSSPPNGMMVQGICIQATPDERSQSAAAALFEGLNSTVASSSLDHRPLPKPSNPRVWIFVGDKPTPLRSWIQ